MKKLQVGTSKLATASHSRVCSSCGSTIEEGEDYMKQSYQNGIEWKTRRICYTCSMKTKLGEIIFHPEHKIPLPHGQRRLSEII